MPTRIIPLGTNGFIPTQGRQTMSFLVFMHEQAILLDAGSGVARLLEQPTADLIQVYPSLSILLSHYHLDHVVGLTYLTAIWHNKPLTIYAPERPLVDASAKEALNTLIYPPYFPVPFPNYPAPVHIVPVNSTNIQIGPVPVRLRAQRHPGGSVGIRLGDDIAYTTDTVIDQANVEFVKGVKLLLHELWLDDAQVRPEEIERTGHSYASGVARLATQAGVGRLMIVHHHPRRSMSEIRQTAETAQALTSARIIVPDEGHIYEV